MMPKHCSITRCVSRGDKEECRTAVSFHAIPKDAVQLAKLRLLINKFRFSHSGVMCALAFSNFSRPLVNRSFVGVLLHRLFLDTCVLDEEPSVAMLRAVLHAQVIIIYNVQCMY